VPTNDGTAQALAYLSKEGTICHVEAEAHLRIEGSVRGGGGVRVLGEAAGADVRLTKPWTPGMPGAEALRFRRRPSGGDPPEVLAAP
jgi:hypothetical protein